ARDEIPGPAVPVAGGSGLLLVRRGQQQGEGTPEAADDLHARDLSAGLPVAGKLHVATRLDLTLAAAERIASAVRPGRNARRPHAARGNAAPGMRSASVVVALGRRARRSGIPVALSARSHHEQG